MMSVNKILNAELSDDNGIISVGGVLNFETVPTLLKQAEQLFKNYNEINIDFSGVVDSNSAGLALLLEMIRTTKIQNKSINFKNLPEQINIVANAYGIDSELGLFLNAQSNS